MVCDFFFKKLENKLDLTNYSTSIFSSLNILFFIAYIVLHKALHVQSFCISSSINNNKKEES